MPHLMKAVSQAHADCISGGMCKTLHRLSEAVIGMALTELQTALNARVILFTKYLEQSVAVNSCQ